jgi:hypothetical protein
MTHGHWPVGPEAHMLGQPGQVGQNSPAMAGSCRCPWRRRSGAEKEGGRGPLGPLAHQEVAGSVGSTRGAPTVAELTAAAAVIYGGISDGVSDSRRLSSIPRT